MDECIRFQKMLYAKLVLHITFFEMDECIRFQKMLYAKLILKLGTKQTRQNLTFMSCKLHLE